MPQTFTPTAHDIETCVEAFEDHLKSDEDGTSERPPPITVMISCGYVEVWWDGEVIAHQRTIFKVDSDGLDEEEVGA